MAKNLVKRAENGFFPIFPRLSGLGCFSILLMAKAFAILIATQQRPPPRAAEAR